MSRKAIVSLAFLVALTWIKSSWGQRAKTDQQKEAETYRPPMISLDYLEKAYQGKMGSVDEDFEKYFYIQETPAPEQQRGIASEKREQADKTSKVKFWNITKD